MDELNRARINQLSSNAESVHPFPEPYSCYLDQHDTAEKPPVSFSDLNVTYPKASLSTSRQQLYELMQNL